MVNTNRTVLVSGAAGRQGGAVIPTLTAQRLGKMNFEFTCTTSRSEMKMLEHF